MIRVECIYPTEDGKRTNQSLAHKQVLHVALLPASASHPVSVNPPAQAKIMELEVGLEENQEMRRVQDVDVLGAL